MKDQHSAENAHRLDQATGGKWQLRWHRKYDSCAFATQRSNLSLWLYKQGRIILSHVVCASVTAAVKSSDVPQRLK